MATKPKIVHITITQGRGFEFPILFPFAIDALTFDWNIKRKGSDDLYPMSQERDDEARTIRFYYEEAAIDLMDIADDYEHALKKTRVADGYETDIVKGTASVVSTVGD